jgi:hypothetical protein
MLSVLQTRSHQLTDLAFAPVTDLSDEDRAQRAVTCRHQLSARQHMGDSRFWLLRLRVELIHPEKGPRSLYLGHCEIVGEFELHPDVPEADRLRTLSYNGGAVLYGAVREWFALLSARSLHGPVEIPTVDARAFIQSPLTPPQPTPTMIIEPGSHLQDRGFHLHEQQPTYRIYRGGPRSALTFTDRAVLEAGGPLAALRQAADADGVPFTDLIYHGLMPLGPVPIQVGRGALDLGTTDTLHLHDLQVLGSRPNRWNGEPTLENVMAAIDWVWEPEDVFPPAPGAYFRFWPKHWHQATWNQLPADAEGGARTRGKYLAFEIYVPPKNSGQNYRISLVRHLHPPSPHQLDEVQASVDAAALALFREQEDHAQHTRALAKWQRPRFPGAKHLDSRFASWLRPNDLFDANIHPGPLEFIRSWLKGRLTREVIANLTNIG